MTLKTLTDQSLHDQLKNLIQQERKLLIQVLEHLAEAERRRLYSDFKRSSLFEYAVNELGYSEDQACRRIQAMRLIKDVPEVSEKLSSGSLTLTNAAKVQGVFRKAKQSDQVKTISKTHKLDIIKTIENKSTREAERELLQLQPADCLPSDRQRAISPTHSELKVVVDQRTIARLEEVRSLLGPKGVGLTHDELLQIMADAAIEKLSEKRFGKRRVMKASAAKLVAKKELAGAQKDLTAAPRVKQNRQQRHITAVVKHAVWQRDQGQCSKCKSQRNLQYDHVKPIGLGGTSQVENLRLLCFSCNQRAAMRV